VSGASSPRPVATNQIAWLSRLCWAWALLVGVWLGAVRIAEANPLTAVLLYLPTLPAVAPLPLLAGWLIIRRNLSALLPLVLGFALYLCLSGVVLPRARGGAHGVGLRIFTVNAWGITLGPNGLSADLLEVRPDVVLLQSVHHEAYDALQQCEALAGFYRQRLGQFAIASRWPIREFEEARQPASGGPAPWARWTLESPQGPVDIFSVHPLSPHQALGELLDRFAQGPRGEPLAGVRRSVSLLRDQTHEVAAAISRARNPVVVAGDTNLPVHSAIFRRELGSLEDAFTEAGKGSGYTYPCYLPKIPAWLRLDRVLTGADFNAVSARVGRRGLSTHCALTVDLVRTR
jgi:endonuclease/exonuclease/phosphatase (EEP) superfamily protein YafD